MDLSYIVEKIAHAPMETHPFKHIHIEDLFSDEDFEQIINSPEIRTKAAQNDRDLFNTLFETNYKVVTFPGCTSNFEEYIDWHAEKASSEKVNDLCEGYGVVLRLEQAQSAVIQALNDFLQEPTFLKAMAQRFDVNVNDCNYDAGIQKYLDGYEISPHPDTRRKCLTYMVNINPNPASEDIEHHTNYLQFTDDWQRIAQYWQDNPKIDRCWVPWAWCDIAKQQRSNNSMVIFSPDYNTLHAVRANFDHLEFQRTQLYGNFWIKNWKKLPTREWYDLDDSEEAQAYKQHLDGKSNKLLRKIKRAFNFKKKKSKLKRHY